MQRHLALLALLAALSSTAWAAGDVASGRQLYDSRCAGCHSVDDNRIGPAHRGVYGRKAGSAPGFAYSDALRKSAIVWNDTTLDAWLSEPEKLVPGQMMNVQVGDAKAREDLVAYLRSLSAR